MRICLVIVLITLCISSCKKSSSDSQLPLPPAPPVIVDVFTVTDITLSDTLAILVYYSDLNNDFLAKSNQHSMSDVNCVLTDNRTGYPDSLIISTSYPHLNQFENAGLFTLYFFPDCLPGKTLDTIIFSLQLRDTVGLLSSKVILPPITLHCQ